jgi:hypothetical protein
VNVKDKLSKGIGVDGMKGSKVFEVNWSKLGFDARNY